MFLTNFICCMILDFISRNKFYTTNSISSFDNKSIYRKFPFHKKWSFFLISSIFWTKSLVSIKQVLIFFKYWFTRWIIWCKSSFGNSIWWWLIIIYRYYYIFYIFFENRYSYLLKIWLKFFSCRDSSIKWYPTSISNCTTSWLV